MLKTFTLFCVTAMVIYGITASTRASTFDRTTYFGFSQPVALPGVTLPAGTYLFRLADPTTGRRIIQVMDRSGSQSYAMLHTLPVYRSVTSSAPEVRFMETAAGTPNAIKMFWSSGDARGYEFVYPKEQLLRLTRGITPAPTNAPTNPPTTSNLIAPVERETVAGADQPAYVDAPAATAGRKADDLRSEETVKPRSEASSPAGYQNEAASAPGQQQNRKELPKTASLIPLALILGLGSLWGGLRLRS